MTDSRQLLAEYARTGSDAAFRELVHRYIDLVYSTAFRLVDNDTQRAEDIAQTVFIDLARMVGAVSSEVMLGGWLHRHTCFVAAKTMRGERRRQIRERQAVEMNALQNHSEPDFALVRPILDEAINELDEPDRTAVLLRFFERRDFRSVGEALGSNEDAARMRVTRALEKLESLLKRRGITTTAAALSTILLANAVQSAPVGLAVSISTAAALAGTTASTSTAIAATAKTIAMTTLQKSIVAVTVAVAAGTGIYQAHQASQLRQQVQTFRQQQAPLTDHIQAVQRERDEATNRVAELLKENQRLEIAAAALQKSHQQEPATVVLENKPLSNTSVTSDSKLDTKDLPKDSWADVGFNTPEESLRTRGWAVLAGNRERFAESLSITPGARKLLEDMLVQMASSSTDPDRDRFIQEAVKNKWGVEEAVLMPLMALNQENAFTGYRILSEQSTGPDEMLMELETEMTSGLARKETLKLHRFGNDWKVVIDEDTVKSSR